MCALHNWPIALLIVLVLQLVLGLGIHCLHSAVLPTFWIAWSHLILNRQDGKLSHLVMAYLLNIICTKNYLNWTTIVKIIIGGW